MMSGELDEKDVLNFIESRPDFLETHFGQGGSASNPNLIDATGKIAANAREEARRLSQRRMAGPLALAPPQHGGEADA